MEASNDGFFYPNVFDPTKCIDCKRCLKVCPLKNEFTGEKAICHIGGCYESDTKIKKSASGGLATALSESFISEGGIVYGVAYAPDFLSSEYVRCRSTNQLDALRGSKYAQEYKNNVFARVHIDLSEGKKVIFFGLPCVVNALKLVLIKDYENLFTVALICHGPTSPTVQKEYVMNLENEYKSQIKYFTLRDKTKGWKPYFIKAIFANGDEFAEEFHPSTFGIAFKELKRPSCSKCRFKLDFNKSHINSDLIIGDFHGVTSSFKFYNKWGVSQCSVLTMKGLCVLRGGVKGFQLEDISARQAIHYNRALNQVIKPRWNRTQFAHAMYRNGLKAACQLNSIKLIDYYDSVICQVKSFLAKMKKKILLK